ncbi:ankyrin repeat domain-containing protein [Cardinium endosymbiont of Nabis limbatus]|uniref:ankyrin repeat domain-containing protein n=1 Tax=Cardinium endosymbiont of Nabis limbatus TaxID=3066217 RepID=UPI003AF38341
MKKYLVLVPLIASCSGVREPNSMMKNQEEGSQGEGLSNVNLKNINNQKLTISGLVAHKLASKWLGKKQNELNLDDIIKHFKEIKENLKYVKLPQTDFFKKKFINALLSYHKKDISTYHLIPESERNNGDLQLIQALLEILLNNPDIDVNNENYFGNSALTLAMDIADPDEDDSRDVIYINSFKILLNHPNIDVNIKDGNGNTPLVLAIRHISSGKELHVENGVNAIKMLLNHKNIDVNKAGKSGLVPILLELTKKNTNIDVLKMLLEHPSNNFKINSVNDSNHTLLKIAIDYCNLEAVKLFLSYPDILVRKEDLDFAKSRYDYCKSEKTKAIYNMLLSHKGNKG